MRADGTAPMLVEVDAHDEAQLQEHMKDNPDLLPLEEFGLTGPLMVVGRETSLASGAADLVGVTRQGDVVIVEFKTGPQNPDFRVALAQLLDYGSDLWQMSVDVFEESVARRYFTGSHCLPSSPVKGVKSLDDAAKAVWDDISTDEMAAMRERLVRSLAEGAFYYVVVAQRFTTPMESTADYLNWIAPKARFCLVELVRFTGDGLSAFEARTVLKPTSQTPKSVQGASLDEAAFLGAITDDRYRQALTDLFEACRGLNLRFEWGSKGTSIRLPTSDKPEPVSVAWVFPPGVPGWMGLHDLTLGYDPTQAQNAPSALPALDRYVAAISQIRGARMLTKRIVKGSSLPPEAVVAGQAAIVEALAEMVRAASGDG